MISFFLFLVQERIDLLSVRLEQNGDRNDGTDQMDAGSQKSNKKCNIHLLNYAPSSLQQLQHLQAVKRGNAAAVFIAEQLWQHHHILIFSHV